MWVKTRSDWPVLINLARAAHVGYQQVAKYDPRTRVIASAWEQEFVLADCADGGQARAVIALLAESLAAGAELLDLNGVDLVALAANDRTDAG